MKAPDIPKVTNAFMKTLAQLAIDEIQHKWETRNDNAVKIDTENIPYK